MLDKAILGQRKLVRIIELRCDALQIAERSLEAHLALVQLAPRNGQMVLGQLLKRRPEDPAGQQEVADRRRFLPHFDPVDERL